MLDYGPEAAEGRFEQRLHELRGEPVRPTRPTGGRALADAVDAADAAARTGRRTRTDRRRLLCKRNGPHDADRLARR